MVRPHLSTPWKNPHLSTVVRVMIPVFDELLARPGTKIALVGATDDPAKYGSTIFHDLTRKGYEVWPVNPNRKTVGGVQAFPDLASLPGKPDIINVVVPPDVGLEVARQALELGYRTVWLQPGAESPELLAFLQTNDFEYLADACIMVRTRVVSH